MFIVNMCFPHNALSINMCLLCIWVPCKHDFLNLMYIKDAIPPIHVNGVR